jgi:hypothetical protein
MDFTAGESHWLQQEIPSCVGATHCSASKVPTAPVTEGTSGTSVTTNQLLIESLALQRRSPSPRDFGLSRFWILDFGFWIAGLLQTEFEFGDAELPWDSGFSSGNPKSKSKNRDNPKIL